MAPRDRPLPGGVPDIARKSGQDEQGGGLNETDAYEQYIRDKPRAERIAVAAVAQAFGAEARAVEPKKKRKVTRRVILTLALVAASLLCATVWTYSSNYSLYCGRATAILGYQMCDDSADGWTREPTPAEWGKIDPVLRSEHLAGNVFVSLGIGAFGYAVLLAGAALRRRGRSLWWLALIALAPLAIIAAVAWVAGLAERQNHKDALGQPKTHVPAGRPHDLQRAGRVAVQLRPRDPAQPVGHLQGRGPAKDRPGGRHLLPRRRRAVAPARRRAAAARGLAPGHDLLAGAGHR